MVGDVDYFFQEGAVVENNFMLIVILGSRITQTQSKVEPGASLLPPPMFMAGK